MPDIFRLLTAGESRGEALTAVIGGSPDGIAEILRSGATCPESLRTW